MPRNAVAGLSTDRSNPRHRSADADRLSVGRAFVAGAVAAVVGVVLTVVGRGGAGRAVAAACWRPRLRLLLTVGACACVATVAAYVVVQQYRFRYEYGFFWVEHFDAVTGVAWLAMLLLGAGACIELVRSRRAPRDRSGRRRGRPRSRKRHRLAGHAPPSA